MKPWVMTPARRAAYDKMGAKISEKARAHWDSLSPRKQKKRVKTMQRNHTKSPYPIHFTKDERADIDARAEAAGLTLTQFIKRKLFGSRLQ